jgi:DNA gyrase subunit B
MAKDDQQDNSAKPKSDSYSADQIKVLEGLDAVREATGDVHRQHRCRRVAPISSMKSSTTVSTSTWPVSVKPSRSRSTSTAASRSWTMAAAFPTGMHSTQKKSAAEVALTVLHAGGKFEQGAYTVSGGLHGVGISVVNALSEWLELEIWQDGQVFEQRYERGKPQAPLAVTGKTKRRGTKVRFKPDGQIFETLEFSFDVLAQRLRELAFLNKGLSITLKDDRKEKEQVFPLQGRDRLVRRPPERSEDPAA